MSAMLGIGSAEARPTEPAELTRYLYERYGQRVFTFCYSRLRDREEAQDAAQTTFIYVLRSLRRGVVPEFELAWLLKIAFNVCRGARRSSGRETAFTQDVPDIDAVAGPAADGVAERERLGALRDALAGLPDTQRRGILLREWQGLSYAEIADELGTTVGAVETLLFRARRNLASRLEHVRSGIGAVNVASLLPFLRSLVRGGLGKLGLIGATASVALVPVVATQVAPALADRRADVKLQASTPAATPQPVVAASDRRSSAATPESTRAPALRSRRSPAVADRVTSTPVESQPAAAPLISAVGADPATPAEVEVETDPIALGVLEPSLDPPLPVEPAPPLVTPTVPAPVVQSLDQVSSTLRSVGKSLP
jgi:RNA polymerase sigma-70 factor (ECF subfamily)